MNATNTRSYMEVLWYKHNAKQCNIQCLFGWFTLAAVQHYVQTPYNLTRVISC